MKKFLNYLSVPFFFLSLTQGLYAILVIFKPTLLKTDWFYGYSAILIFLFFVVGWILMHYYRRRYMALFGGLILFLWGELLGLGLPLLYGLYQGHWTFEAYLHQLIQHGSSIAYLGATVIGLSFLAAHICGQYERHQPSPK